MAGYGLSNALGPSKAGIDFITLMPRVGYVFAESRRTPPLRGSLQGVVEAVPALVAFEDAQTIYGGGFNLLLRYDVATGTRVVPFLEGGAGNLLSTPNRPTGDPSSQPRSLTSPCRSAPAYAIFSPHRRPSASPTAFITFQMPTPPRIIPGSTPISSCSDSRFSGKRVAWADRRCQDWRCIGGQQITRRQRRMDDLHQVIVRVVAGGVSTLTIIWGVSSSRRMSGSNDHEVLNGVSRIFERCHRWESATGKLLFEGLLDEQLPPCQVTIPHRRVGVHGALLDTSRRASGGYFRTGCQRGRARKGSAVAGFPFVPWSSVVTAVQFASFC